MLTDLKDIWDTCLAEKKQVMKEHKEFNSVYVKFYKHIHTCYLYITKMLTVVIFEQWYFFNLLDIVWRFL